MPSVIFRADGGSVVGMGHLTRCMALASEFIKQGWTVSFISRIEEGILHLRQHHYSVMEIHTSTEPYYDTGSPYFDIEATEISKVISDKIFEKISEKISEAVSESESESEPIPDLFILDSYNVTPEYLGKLSAMARKLCYIDDVNKFNYPVDILINGNLSGAYMQYHQGKQDKLMLLGSQYTIMRDEFNEVPQRTLNERITRILITSGGSDTFDMCERIARMIVENEKWRDVFLDVIVGTSFHNKNLLYQLALEYPNIVLHEHDSKDKSIENYYIKVLMLSADIAISSGGSTLYELCRCGTPTLVYMTAQNQELGVAALCQDGYLKSLGWYGTVNEKSLMSALAELRKDYSMRLALSKRMQQLVDGKGKLRIVEEITRYIGGKHRGDRNK